MALLSLAAFCGICKLDMVQLQCVDEDYTRDNLATDLRS